MSSFAAMALVLAPWTGCAKGTGGGESPPPMIGGTGGTTEAATTRGDEDEDSSTSDSMTSLGTTTGPMPVTTSGASDESGSFGSSESSGGGEVCVNMLTCNTATVLGVVSGDENSPVLNFAGSDPIWLTFRVTENNDGLSGESLNFEARLTSPAGYDFDLFAFRGRENGTSGCGGAMDESTGVGLLDVVAMDWGEGGVANGGDESAWVALQVESKTGTCDPTAEWTLAVEGDK